MRAALVWVFFIGVIVLAGPLFLSDYSQVMNLSDPLRAPSMEHWLGTDSLGRDLLARILCGAQISVGVAFFAVLLSLLVGVLVGAVSGYLGGWVDRCLMALADTLLCFPSFFLILAVIAVLGPGLGPIVVIIGLTGWMGTARLVRAEVLTLKERDFVTAARAFGAPASWIILRHLIPNALGPALIHAILGISGAILLETGLSFLGIGVQPPTPSWGNILQEGKAVLGAAWWMTFFPGMMIFLTVLSVNLIGEKFSKKLEGQRQ